jgi:hypothetical protein
LLATAKQSPSILHVLNVGTRSLFAGFGAGYAAIIVGHLGGLALAWLNGRVLPYYQMTVAQFLLIITLVRRTFDTDVLAACYDATHDIWIGAIGGMASGSFAIALGG